MATSNDGTTAQDGPLPQTMPRSVTGDARPLTDVGDGAGLAWAMVDASPDALVVVDGDGQIELVNHQTEVLFGYDRGELLGRPVEILLPGELEAVHRAHRTRYRAAPEVRSMGSGLDLLGRRRDGTEFPVEVSLSPLLQDGQQRVIAAVRDVSERRTGETAARRIRQGIDSILDGVYMFTPDTMRFVYVNEGATIQTGYTAEALLGEMTPLMFVPDFTADQFAELLQPLLDDSSPSIQFETTLRPSSGQDFPVEVVMDFPGVNTGAQRVLVCVVRDISVRREAEDKAEIIQHSIDAVSDAVFVCDENTLEFLHVNRGAVDLHGYTRDELLDGMTPATLAPNLRPEDVQAALARLTTAPGESALLVADGVSRSGEIVPVEVSINWPLPAREGAPRPVVAVVRDISDRVAADAARRRQEALTVGLSEIRLAMLEGASRAEGLKLVCESAVATLDAEVAMIVTPTGHGDELAVEAAVNLADEVRAGLSFSTTKGVAGEVFTTGQAQFTGAEDPRLSPTNRSIVEERRAGSIIEAPLHGAEGVVGVFIVVRGIDSDPLDTEDLKMIEHFASQTVLAVEVAALRQSQAQLELMEDRDRMGRDLHDHVIGRLFATGMSLQAATTRLDDAASLERVVGAVNEIDEAIKDIRTAIYGVRSQPEWGKGIRGEILALAAEQNEILGFEPTVSLEGPIDDLPAPIAEGVRAAIREALTNIAKHAAATSVTIAVTATQAGVEVEIVDNGVGFSANDRATSSELTNNGLRNITERAKALSGHATVRSHPGEGATITWTVPSSEP